MKKLGYIITFWLVCTNARAGLESFVVEHQWQSTKSPTELTECLLDISQWWPSDHTWSGNASKLSLTLEHPMLFVEQVDGISVQHLSIDAFNEAGRLVMSGGLGPLSQMGASGLMVIDYRDPSVISLNYRVVGDGTTDLAAMQAPVTQVINQQFGAWISYCN